MSDLNIPFNIEPLNLNDHKDWLKITAPVTSTDIFQLATKALHPTGLFSPDLFGTPGTKARMTKEAYIDLKLPIFSPVIFYIIGKVRSLHLDIMAGSKLVIWDDKLKDFVESNTPESVTGYAAFFSRFKDIVYRQTESDRRSEMIDVLAKYKEHASIDKLCVLPAGFRDVEIDDSGRVTSDEINELYGSVIAIGNTISLQVARAGIDAYDRQRWTLQNKISEIFAMMLGVIRGKNGLMLGKWMSRNVFDSTRAVITAMDTSVHRIGEDGNPTIDTVQVGLLQFIKSVRPKAIYHLRSGILSEVFVSGSAPAHLVNPKTLKSEMRRISARTYDRWTSTEGLEKIMDSYRNSHLRKRAIMIDGAYLALVYRGPDHTFRVIHGIDELPEGRLAEHCTPMTYTDLFYLSCYQWADGISSATSRYPIATERSVSVLKTQLMSTTRWDDRVPLNDAWEPIRDPEMRARRFPIPGLPTFDALAVHPSREKNFGADHDGDMMGYIPILTEEGNAEANKLYDSYSYYISNAGTSLINLSTDTVSYIYYNLTGGFERK